uniref:hypothetical protein n=1 Tax=Diaporthe sojae TaxID=165439 RepID=UPI00240F079B|nr:hypothetical protein QAZ32_mgp51 [Diaporthe sojae]WET30388.1 hypothetical protein [Diaporthe sojae]
MTFFVCFYILLGFLVLEIEDYILYSDSEGKFAEAIKELIELDKKVREQNKKYKKWLDEESSLNKKPTDNKETAKKESIEQGQKSKQDSSNVVDDGSEPTPLTDLDGGD